MSQYDKMRADPLEAVRAARAIIADGDRRGQAAEQRTTVHTRQVLEALGAIRETERKEQLRRQQEVADLLVDYGCHYLDGVCKCEAYYDCKYYRKDFPGRNRGGTYTAMVEPHDSEDDGLRDVPEDQIEGKQ